MLRRFLIGLLFIASSPLLAAEARSPHSMLTVTNIEALRGLPTAGQYATVNVQGYYTANDGGGGIFNWNSTSTATKDDCLVFSAAGNPKAGRYIRQDAQSSPYSVRWCGAKGDGITDDYAAIMTAVAIARGHAQSIVYLPPGLYVLGTVPLDVSGVSVEGAGAIASKLKRGNGASGPYTVKLDGSTMGGASRMTYRNFQIDGNSSANSHPNFALALVGNVLNNVFENIQILKSLNGGLRIIRDVDTRPNVDTFVNLQIRDGNGKGVEVDAGRNLHFSGLDIENVGDTAIDLRGNDEALGRILIQNFWIENSGAGNFDAIRIAGYSDRIGIEYGNIQDYGNKAGTQGHGINIVAGRRVRIRGLDISPRTGVSAPGHRKILIGPSSTAITLEDMSFGGEDIEDNSARPAAGSSYRPVAR
jgi:hypothetical protein